MNNNRNNNNNRRRGRGNRQQQGGGNQNRIDSRARGNAPQLLDKYKKLAQDAQHNGDRVQAEYYLQFADHYFRVIADNRVRHEEVRGGGRPDRDYASDDDTGDEDDFDPMRQGRDERVRDDRPRDDRPRDDRPREERSRDERPRDDRSRDERGRGQERQRGRGRPDDGAPRGYGNGEAPAEASEYEPAENPFVARDRGRERGLRPRGSRRDGANEATEELAGDRGAIDAAALPPSFSLGVEGEPTEAPPKPVRRRRKPGSEDGAGEGDGGSLTAVG